MHCHNSSCGECTYQPNMKDCDEQPNQTNITVCNIIPSRVVITDETIYRYAFAAALCIGDDTNTKGYSKKHKTYECFHNWLERSFIILNN